MAAKLATVDEHILANAEGSGAIPDGAFVPQGSTNNRRLAGCNLTADTSHRSSSLTPNAWK
jgi:hypothetical protein